MVPAGNKTKRLLSFNHTTKTIHHHHHHHHHYKNQKNFENFKKSGENERTCQLTHVQNHGHANKIRRTYARDVRELSNTGKTNVPVSLENCKKLPHTSLLTIYKCGAFFYRCNTPPWVFFTFFQLVSHLTHLSPSMRTSRRHANSLKTAYCRSDYFKNSFIPKVVNEWNKLYPDSRSSISHNLFRN